jgi:hypothetical protein
MPFNEIIGVYAENYTLPINTLCSFVGKKQRTEC